MKGYKVFKNDWTCRGFQYAVGETYEMEDEPSCCNRGFHFCGRLIDCFNYYDFDSNNKVAEIEATGAVDDDGNEEKYCTNKIRIVRELSWHEVLDLVNTGKDNTGNRNTGNRNTGDWNTGNRNTGDWNTGNRNTGDRNTGDRNTGDWNTGNRNTGDRNTGDRNTGNRNTGDWNTGNRNTGDRNTGDWNTGNRNTGDRNTGDRNTGDWNTGNWNTGDWNTGNRNTGDWNSTEHSTGCFNTETENIRLFNKPSDWTYHDWLNSRARYVMNDCPHTKTIWIDSEEMIDSEKEENPTWECTGGYLKTIHVTNSDKQAWWDNLDESDKESVMSLPNFDRVVFKEVTGIEV